MKNSEIAKVSLIKLLEDLEDLRLLAERKNEATSSLEEVEARLKAKDLL